MGFSFGHPRTWGYGVAQIFLFGSFSHRVMGFFFFPLAFARAIMGVLGYIEMLGKLGHYWRPSHLLGIMGIVHLFFFFFFWIYLGVDWGFLSW